MELRTKRYTWLVAILMCLFVAQVTHAAVMSSLNYSIDADSVNSGGVDSSSPSYLLQETVGEIGTGDLSSANFNMYSGYQQMLGSSISISLAPDVVLAPGIDGAVGGVATGTTAVTVITDNPAGYTLFIAANTNPALRSTDDSFADYVPSGLNPDLNFTVLGSASAFGFSPEGADISSSFKDDGNDCGVGVLDTAESCWEGLSTSNQTIAGSGSGNAPLGTETTLQFRAEAGATRGQNAGAYRANSTLTALAL